MISFILAYQILQFVLLLSNNGISAEGDSFTTRNFLIPEGIDIIDTEVRSRIKRAVAITNDMSSCKMSLLEINLGVELLRPFYGKIEHYANISPLVPKAHVPFDQSIYRGIPDYYFGLLQIGEALFGFGHMIREGEWLIGSDKFGHFFDEGHDLFLRLDDQSSNIQDVLEVNEKSEEGVNGLALGGIKSYGDMVANFNGMVFWAEMLDQKYPGRRPYVRCHHNQWAIVRDFSFHDYIDAGWDEAFNCNDYATESFQTAVNLSIARQGERSGRFTQCPLHTMYCQQMHEKYQHNMTRLINPKSCRVGAR